MGGNDDRLGLGGGDEVGDEEGDSTAVMMPALLIELRKSFSPPFMPDLSDDLSLKESLLESYDAQDHSAVEDRISTGTPPLDRKSVSNGGLAATAPSSGATLDSVRFVCFQPYGGFLDGAQTARSCLLRRASSRYYPPQGPPRSPLNRKEQEHLWNGMSRRMESFQEFGSSKGCLRQRISVTVGGQSRTPGRLSRTAGASNCSSKWRVRADVFQMPVED